MDVSAMTGPLRLLRGLPPWVVDAGLGALFVVVVAIEAAGRPSSGERAALLAVLTLVLALSLALRRRAPLVALAVGTAALVSESFLHVATVLTPLATLVGAYSVGMYATRVRARWGVMIIVAGVVGYFAGTPGLSRTNPVSITYVLLVWLAGWAVGYVNARRREDQDRARRAVEGQVVAEERVRMSRELHDVVGHTVNLLVVQAGAARMTLDSDPARARELLQAMEETGRNTLGELDRVLATLRSDAREVEGPGLAQIPDLIGRFRDSGVAAQLWVDPELRPPPELDLSAYRIVQEALTNSLKHAAPCAATVVVSQMDGAMIIEVSDTGPGAGQIDHDRRGLQGIAERVAMCGGALEHSNGEQGGFRVRAILPLPTP